METDKSSANDSEQLESLFQAFLNEITNSFEKHKVPSARLDEFERRVMKGESLLQILEVIFDMFLELMRHVDNKAGSARLSSTANLLRAPEKEAEDSTSPEEKYAGLEKLLQKYEAQIRDHIRVEQQLKIYVENMQENFAEKETQLKESLFTTKKTLADLEIRTQKLEKRLQESGTENKILKDLLKGVHGASVISQTKTIGNVRDSQESIKEKDSLLGKTDLFGRKGEGHKSIPRAKSREISPLQVSKSKKKQQYISVMEQSMKGKKALPKNLLLNFKKIYSKAKAEVAISNNPTKDFTKTEVKDKEPIVKNYINFIKMQTISTQPQAESSMKRALRSHRSKDHSKDRFHSRKASESQRRKYN